MPLYRQTFEVTGSGTFPYDMLRYDECFPRYERESPLLDSNERMHDADYFVKPRTVTMQRLTRSTTSVPTAGRWRSFNWTVVEGSLKTERC